MQWISVLYASRDFFFLFSVASLSASVVCTLFRVPFYNPEMSHRDRQRQTLALLSFGCKAILTVAPLFALTGGYDKLSREKESIVWIPPYILLIEFAYYGYHRFAHTKCLFPLIHAKHHERVHVFPMDAYHVDLYDSFGNVVSLLYPVYFLPISLRDFKAVAFFYLTSIYLIHSEHFVRIHSLHHTRYVKNYCFVFPLFDLLFGTFSREGLEKK